MTSLLNCSTGKMIASPSLAFEGKVIVFPPANERCIALRYVRASPLQTIDASRLS